MKLKLYWLYAVRSLTRGGQRTLLAIFCVAVGVLAIVALQLVGNMVNHALTDNIRAGNGGDISVSSPFTPLNAQRMEIFPQLLTQGQITDYTAVSRHEVQTISASGSTYFSLQAVDPAKFPLVGRPIFSAPAGASVAGILANNHVIVTKDLAQALRVSVGARIAFTSDDGRAGTIIIGGVVENAGVFDVREMLISLADYSAIRSSAGLPVTFTTVYANVPGNTDANAAAVESVLQDRLPNANVTTTKEALQGRQTDVQNIRYFLEIVGLLALLIGGVGIVNTMQVLLRRRRTEIAMLKTTGYRQRDLYAMFGLETGLIGLVGGVAGALIGVGVSFLVKSLVERVFFISLPTIIDPVTVALGVAIGFATALIFGILPIVQASRVRPLAVLRELPEGAGRRSTALAASLTLLLLALFFLLAWSILGNLVVSAGAIGGGAALILCLSALFSLIVVVISRLPVLETFRWWYVLLILMGLVVAFALGRISQSFGVLFAVVSVFGVVVVLLPRAWKSNIRMALRNIGRQKARTVTTLVALYIGVFAIGLILVLGQNIKDQINAFLTTSTNYNSFILVNAPDKAAVDQAVSVSPDFAGVPRVIHTVSQDEPVAINGVPIGDLLKGAPAHGSLNNLGKNGSLFLLSGVQGFDLGHGQQPTDSLASGAHAGRQLTTADAGTNAALLPQSVTQAPLRLALGDTVTVADQSGKTVVSVRVVGFYTPTLTTFAPIYTDIGIVNQLTKGKPLYVYSLNLNPKTADAVMARLHGQVAGIQTFTVGDFARFITSLLNNLIVMLEAIASLAMIAGVIIIANAVALAMLERRRELGILKAVGHTSQSVLGGVLLENGVVGFVGGFLAMLLVTFATTALSKALFKTSFGVSAPIVLATVLGTSLVCMCVAALVAWNATRVRPLEVLRYE